MRPQTIVERLDFVAKRIPGLKFTPPTQLKPGDDQGYGCFMSCDMYYIEIKVDQSHQTVKDVVISHGNNAEGISCPVLRKVLADQDFETFAKHLSGLHSIYQISTNDKKVKQRAYPALTALETDLSILYDHQRRRTNNCYDLVHKSPIGIMEPRRGGLPVRLNFFITPYDLIDSNSRELITLTLNNIVDKNLGLSATVEIEGSGSHKLQVKSLISSQQNSTLPAYAPFNSQNSEKLPAQFVLKLCQPLPILNTSIHQIIQEINEPITIKEYLSNLALNSRESLVSLIARQELDLNKGPFSRSIDLLKNNDNDSRDSKKHIYSIRLPDQHHIYHILDNHVDRQDGVYITTIPFTHPTSIPNILRVLRQQAVMNSVLGSCIRRSKNGTSNTNNNNFDEEILKEAGDTSIFDVIPVNLTNICVSFEHPSKESLATLEIDIKELCCQLYALDRESVCSNDYATKVFQKCWSIPITLRSVLKKCNERRLALLEDANKRRERELQELLTSTTSQQNLQYKPNLNYQEQVLQTKFQNVNDKSNRDLNSIAEYLTSKITNNASTSVDTNQPNNDDGSTNRSNLLKKFSCKPKAKQNTATKNQTGNKILSLMLKRQNSTPSSVDDASLKATLVKKVKVKNEQSTKSSDTGLMTEFITPEVINMSRPANKANKQGSTAQNISVSLIRSPNKSQSSSSSVNQGVSLGLSLNNQATASSSKQTDIVINSIHARQKSQPNGSNNLIKPRKSSIGAILDSLVDGVTPPDPNASSNASSVTERNSDIANKNLDSSKNSPLGKSKSRASADQFAIKQGSLGGLKLTVTKTKPTTTASSSASSSTSSNPPTNTTLSSSTSATNCVGNKPDANKILSIGSSSTISKYTIPKISKTQQASQSNQTNSSEVASESQPSDESVSTPQTNSSFSATSSTGNKRTISTIFNRTNTQNRNPVSSSTHPLGRTTSNPLANAGRASSASTNENHVMNRISSSNQNQIMRHQQNNNRAIGVQLQGAQRMVTPNLLSQQQQQASTVQGLNQTPMFALGLNQQPAPFLTTTPDINILASNSTLSQHRSGQVNQGINSMSHYMSSSLDTNLISSSRPQLSNAGSQSQSLPVAPIANAMSSSVCDSLQRPTPSVINGPPQFYMKQPIFEETPSTVSSTPKIVSEASQSSFNDRRSMDSNMNLATALGFHPRAPENSGLNSNEMSSTGLPGLNQSNPGVSSSSDTASQESGFPISTPSSPTECSQIETIAPPPLIPIDSVEEPQAISPDNDHPDDESDRLSIVDTNENIADSNNHTK